MKRILVPVDFSPTSQKAFRYTVDIASKVMVLLYCIIFIHEENLKKRAFENVRAYNQQMEINSLKSYNDLGKSSL